MSTALVFWMVIVSGGLIERSAHASEGCSGERALSTRRLGSVSVVNAPVPLGSWNLPINHTLAPRPSAAKVELSLVEGDAGLWSFQFRFSFFDPVHPLGIPYSFQKLHLTWETPAGPKSLWVDWSEGCSSVGYSLYPGQAWMILQVIPEQDLSARLENLRMEIFGSRN